MILPVIAYGDPVLRKKCEEISNTYPDVKSLIANMFETMYASNGVGLAAPQIGLSIRLFIIDPSPFAQDKDIDIEQRKALESSKKVFINAEILQEEGESWKFNEGCLSIPGVHEDISRQKQVTIRYQDENFNTHTDTFSGMVARVIQHEYDHIEGILFTDKISSFKKRLIKGKLANISKGNVKVDYRMKFPNAPKKRA